MVDAQGEDNSVGEDAVDLCLPSLLVRSVVPHLTE